MEKKLNKVLPVLIALTISFSGFAQETDEMVRGESEHFTVYYEQADASLASETIDFMEGEYERITKMIGYVPVSLTEIRIADTDNPAPADVSGITVGKEPLDQNLREELVYQYSRFLLHEMMFGNSIEKLFDGKKLRLPEWFINGAAKYIASGSNEEMEEFMQENIERMDRKWLDKLKGEEAVYAGQSIWNFMQEAYGPGYMSSSMNYLRIIRDREKAIEVSVGLTYDMVLQDWKNFYADNANEVNEEK